jgi:hypothetical protein
MGDTNNFALRRFREYQQGVALMKDINNVEMIAPMDLQDIIKQFVRGEIDNKKIELDRLIYSLTYPHKSVLLSAMVNTAFEYLEYNLGDMGLSDDDIEKLEKIINKKNKSKIRSNAKLSHLK